MLRIAVQIPVYAACLALFGLMVMTFSDVVLRSVANAPLSAATELTRILMAVIVFSIMPMVSTSGQHVAVDLTDPVFDRLGLARLRDGVIYLVCGALLYWPLNRVWVLAERGRDFGDVTEYLNIPVFYVGWFIALSLAVTMVAMLITGVLTLVRPDLLERRS
jgi:TRAP-type C4-dicarboxylate transport system permease small subunit